MNFSPLSSAVYDMSEVEKKRWLAWETAGRVDLVAGFQRQPHVRIQYKLGEVIVTVRAGDTLAEQSFDEHHILNHSFVIDYAVMLVARDAVVMEIHREVLDAEIKQYLLR
jgi:hypothetical protein